MNQKVYMIISIREKLTSNESLYSSWSKEDSVPYGQSGGDIRRFLAKFEVDHLLPRSESYA